MRFLVHGLAGLSGGYWLQGLAKLPLHTMT